MGCRGGVLGLGGGGVGEEMRRLFSRHVDYLFRSLIIPEVLCFNFEISQMIGALGSERGRRCVLVCVCVIMALTRTWTFTFLLRWHLLVNSPKISCSLFAFRWLMLSFGLWHFGGPALHCVTCSTEQGGGWWWWCLGKVRHIRGGGGAREG